MYISIIILLILLVQVFRIMFLRERYGKKKGDFIAMTLLLSVLPLILLSNAMESMGAIFFWFLLLAIIINWAYSLYVFKFSTNK